MERSSIKRVLVVYKTSPYERYDELGELDVSSGEDGDSSTIMNRLQDGHAANQAAIARVQAALDRSGLQVLVRPQPTKREAATVDLVISVGGDGTFLATAQRVRDAVMLGVNSAPGSSVGHYCGTDAAGFEEALDELLSGEAEIATLGRIDIRIGHRVCPLLALNDVLFANRSPACSSRYILKAAAQEAFQTSSGIWISTASGASGAMQSAGGAAMEPGDHRLQFRVRELYGDDPVACALTEGLTEEPIVVIPRTPNHMIYLDGQLRAYRAGFGTKVSFRLAETPLRLARYRPSP